MNYILFKDQWDSLLEEFKPSLEDFKLRTKVLELYLQEKKISFYAKVCN